ncbi:MAG: hypothetical protein A2284_14385 [Deltaproteobacteria bacterium RIFOXYA12_FULL_61_11]|nr:MAG: hypothetical protein A2284_14385 [Deltaproteobacteria bacterium RIFOXYA12_FULL_61_11]
MHEFVNRVAVVTGASSGIGRACALGFCRGGACVVAVGRDGTRLRELTEAGAGEPGRILPVSLDLTKHGAVQAVVDAALTHFGRIDILVNAAGILTSGSVETTSAEAWDRLMDLNLRVPFLLLQRCLPQLQSTAGAVVNVSSVTGLRSFPGVLGYCVSKAGLDQLTRCAALELASRGVRVNAVNPGVVRTSLHRNGGMDETTYAAFLEHGKESHPLGRVGEAEEIAEAVLFLASPRSGWITGATLPIDGGRAQTCAR